MAENPKDTDKNAKKRNPLMMDLGSSTRPPFVHAPHPEKERTSPTPDVPPRQNPPDTTDRPPKKTQAQSTPAPQQPESPQTTKTEKKGNTVLIACISLLVIGVGAAIFSTLNSAKSTKEIQETTIPIKPATVPEPKVVVSEPPSLPDWKTSAETMLAEWEASESLIVKVLGDDARNTLMLDKSLQSASKALQQGHFQEALEVLTQAKTTAVAHIGTIIKTRYVSSINSLPVKNARNYASPDLEKGDNLSNEVYHALEREDLQGALALHEQAMNAIAAWKPTVTAKILSLARAAAANKEIDTGKYYYQELLKLDPANTDAKTFLYRYYYRAGQIIQNSIGMQLAYIPPGEFYQGSPQGEEGRDPDETAHTTVLTRGFFMSVIEVTQGQWASIMGDPLSKVSADRSQGSGFIGASMPMHSITYAEAVAYCDRLSAKDHHTYRLPTEAEWEYAARAETTSAYANGSDRLTPKEANIYAPSLNRESPVAAGSLGFRNRWGLNDTMGNVWEWCSDWYAPYPAGVSENPTGPASTQSGRADLAMRVVRGGSWNDDSNAARSANRWQNSPVVPTNYIGFRIVMEVTEFNLE